MKTIVNTSELMAQIKEKNNLSSDYQLHKFMTEEYGKTWTRAAVSKLVNQTQTCSDTKAIDIANALELDPGYVIAALKAGRETDKKVREIWEKIAGSMATMALVILLTLPLPAVSAPLNPSSAGHFNNLYIVSLLFMPFGTLPRN